MYWFGKKISSQFEWMHPENWSNVSELKESMALSSVKDIVLLLDQFGKIWKRDSQIYLEAIIEIKKNARFSEEEIQSTLDILPNLLKQENLEARLRSEFGDQDVLDRFTRPRHFMGQIKAVPRGGLLHVTAGNVFLSSIDSLIMGFLTKNISFLKVSSSNQFFPLYFAQKLNEFDQSKLLSNKFAVLHWKGGDEEVENFIKSKVDTIIAWGGEEMVRSYRKDLPLSVKLIDFGPKISIQVITKKGIENKDLSKVAQAIVSDITPWGQSACASPQNLYLQEGIDENLFLKSLSEAFMSAPKRGEISQDEAVEILKERYRGFYSEFMNEGQVIFGPEFLIHLEKDKFIRPSPLGRSLIVKRFVCEKDLFNHLSPFSYYLQSCSYLFGEAEKSHYLNLLSLTGIKRFAPLGTITWGMEGAPHDGRFVLRELVNFISDELRFFNYGELQIQFQSSTQLREHFEKTPHPQGFIFSSGGTTGSPKYVHFSYEEFDSTTDMLAHNFRAQGINAGMTVANLFVAGNLWSSFIAVEKALEKIGAIQLPIGGMCPSQNILTYLEKFKPDVIMGIPSLLVETAVEALNLGINLKIKKVFYAGEAMSQSRRDFLEKHWQTQYFGSAGYASVDAGVIGYQCDKCAPGEHHLFSDIVDLKIIKGEAIVSSLIRESMNIKNYPTGDRVEWVDELCQCGRHDKKFKLLGRVDNLIQVWSCRVQLNEIEEALKNLDPDILSYQIKFTEVNENNYTSELMEVLYETTPGQELELNQLAQEIYQNSRDLRDTITFESFKKKIILTPKSHGEIVRNSRTGKISTVIDQRF